MSDVVGAAVGYIDRRLATMERSPGTWGGSESLELQALLLLEMRTFLLRPRTYAKAPYEVRDAYIRFIAGKLPGAPASFMADALPPDRVQEELPRLLAELRDQVVARLGPEDPFKTSALVLELRFEQRARTGSFRRVCRCFDRFVRSIGAIARAEEQEKALVFATPDIRLHVGESGPHVQLLLDRPRGSRASVERFLGALERAMAMAEWAMGEDDPRFEKIRASFSDRTERLRVAEHVRALVPSRVPGAPNLRIGGKAVRHAPVDLAPEASAQLDALLAGERRLRIAGVPPSWSEGFAHVPAEPAMLARVPVRMLAR
jgi:hypothetical protein